MSALEKIFFMFGGICGFLSTIMMFIMMFCFYNRFEKIEKDIKHPLFDRILELECELYGNSKQKRNAKQNN